MLLLALVVGVALAVGTESRDIAAETASAATQDESEARWVEAKSRRTEYSKTFSSSEGPALTRVFAAPVHFREAGGWQEIDTSLVASDRPGYAYRNGAGAYRVELPERLDTTPVRVEAGAAWLTLTPENAQGPVGASGSAARYAAWPAAELRYDVEPAGVKESLVLADASAARSYRFRLRLSDGLVARQNASGDIEVSDSGGTRFFLPDAVVWDARDRRARPNVVRQALSREGSDYVLELALDSEWLAAPEREFPVVIDPSVRISVAAAGCTMLSGEFAEKNYCTTDPPQVASFSDYVVRAMLKFDVSSVPATARVAQSTLYLHRTTGSSTADGVGAWRLTRSWTSGATWNRHDGSGAWTTPGGDFASSTGTFTTVGPTNGGYSWDVLSIVRSWVDGSQPNHGFLLKLQSETSGGTHTFTSPAYTAGAVTSNTPYLDVVWEPETSIASGPTGTVSSSSASFSFSSDTAGATFECRRDGGAWEGCASPKSYSGLPDGPHTFDVRAIHAGATDSTPATRSWTVDTTPPDTSIVSGPSGSVSSTSASFGFSSPEGSASFECQLDTGAWGPCTSPKAYSGLADGSHTFRVRAKDAVGNTDPTPATRTWTVDTTPPDTAIDSGPSGTVSSAAASFAFSSPDSGAGFECQLNAGAWEACTSPTAYSGLSDGPHTFRVRAKDAAGNVDATPASRSWTVDTTPPDTSVDAGPSGTVSSTSASFEFSSPDAGAGFECQLNAGAWEACASPKAYSGLGGGDHTFRVRAKDTAGNVDPTPATRSWTVAAEPDTQIVTGPAGLVASSSATFSFSSSDASATFQCRLDGGGWESCASPKTYTDLSDGSHTLEVRAVGSGGLTDASPASRSWTVDTTAPDSSIDSGPSGTVASTSATFAFSSPEAGVSFECQLDAGAWAPCTSPESYSGLSGGDHVFRVRAKDAAGNVDATPSARSWRVVTAPETQIDSGPSGVVASGSATFTFSSSQAGATFQCSLDGATWESCSSPKSFSGLTEGAHVLEVRAVGELDVVDPTPAVRNWTVDTTPPDTSIDSGPSGTVTSANASFGFSSPDPGASVFECRLDFGSWVACTSPASYTGLDDSAYFSSHVFEVRAKDGAGNVDAAPARRAWTIDATRSAAPDIDCWIQELQPSVRSCGQGGATTLYAGKSAMGTPEGTQRALLKFGLPALPSRAVVSRATVVLRGGAIEAAGAPLQLREMTRAWTTDLNWSTSDGVSAWTTPGGDFNAVAGSSAVPASAGAPIDVDVTATAAGWYAGTIANLGLLARTSNDSEPLVPVESSAVSDATRRPKLAVKYEVRTDAANKVSLPEKGHLTARRLRIQGTAANSAITAASFEYLLPGQKDWETIPVGAVRDTDGVSIGAWPVAVENGKTPVLVLDASALPGVKDGPMKVRAHYNGSAGGVTEPVDFRLDRKDPSVGASQPIGPGSVNLLTGNFSLDRSDVSVESFKHDLTLLRTYNSRGSNKRTADLFGPGWQSSMTVDGPAMSYRSVYRFSEWELGEVVYDPEEFAELAELEDIEGTEESEPVEVWYQVDYAVVELVDGSKVKFVEADGQFFPEDPDNDLSLRNVAGSGDLKLSLADGDGAITIFQRPTAGAPEYRPVEYHEPGGGSTKASFAYEMVGAAWRMTNARAPVSPQDEGSCGVSGIASRGCRTVRFEYGNVATPTGAQNRLTGVYFRSWDRAQAQTVERKVAQYEYDANGRLAKFFDPRISPALAETYQYDAQGRLTGVTPAGEEPWTLVYEPTATDPEPGRLKSVSRSALAAGTATTTLAYDVPIGGADAPYQMGKNAAAAWGQQDLPTDATAVFPPDQEPSNPPTSYTRAVITYMNERARTVNVVAPGGHTTTSEYDKFGNVVRELTAANRARALAAGAQSPTRAAELDTQHTYDATGLELTRTLGPLHRVRLDSGELVDARQKIATTYDEGKPASLPATHLPTRLEVSAQIASRPDADTRTTVYRYTDPNGSNRGWELREASQTIVDPNGLNLKSVVIHHDTEPVVIERRMPGHDTAARKATATRTAYYGMESGNAGIPFPDECKGNAEWWGLPCKVQPAEQPNTAGLPDLPVTTYEYNALHQVTKETDTVGTSTRTTSTTYDLAGRQTSEEVTGNEGTPLPAVSTTYHASTGRLASTTSTSELGMTTAISRSYDTLGRPTSYTDADGNTATTAYDLLDRPVTTNDGKGTQTRTYDPASGLLTRLDDSAAGTFTATYDPDGQLTSKTYPNGMRADTAFDATGAPTALSYIKTSNCQANCTWYDEQIEESIHGQWVRRRSTLSGQDFTYDAASRLSRVRDTLAGESCPTTRGYSFDANSNRTGLTTETASGGGCAITSGETRTHGYDAADRLTDAGVQYDSFGRITSLPGSHAGGGTLTSSYYLNDLVRSQTQDDVTKTWSLDPAHRQRATMPTLASTDSEIMHYADDSDSPAWIARQTLAVESSFTRMIEGIDGDLAAIQDSQFATTLQLQNLHGDVIATASPSDTATAPLATFETDEFGVPREPAERRYGWLGAKQRRTELRAGVIQMGVRSYVPALGRFLQVDPIDGGSANAYDYAYQDPVNLTDLDGRWAWAPVVVNVLRAGVGYAAKKIGGRGGRRVGRRLSRGADRIARASPRTVAAVTRSVMGGLYRGALKQGSVLKRLFGRRTRGANDLAGAFNRNRWVRLGVSWNDKKQKNVFRVALGYKGGPFHLHRDLYTPR